MCLNRVVRVVFSRLDDCLALYPQPKLVTSPAAGAERGRYEEIRACLSGFSCTSVKFIDGRAATVAT